MKATFNAASEPTDAIEFRLTPTQQAHAEWAQRKAVETRNNPDRRYESLPEVTIPSGRWRLVP